MLFITGSGTDVGKTFVTALMARQLLAAGRRPAVLKPVLSGYDPGRPGDSDAGALLAALGEAVTDAAVARISPWRFAAPLSPDMAAAREGRAVPFREVLDFCREAQGDPVLVEGVGGALVPLDGRHTVADWIGALNCPAVVVGGTYLGAISHCLTTIEALRARGVPLVAAILSESAQSPVSPEETAAAISRFSSLQVRVAPRGGAGAPDLTDLAP